MKISREQALQAAVDFHTSLLGEYTPRAAFGLAVMFLARKGPFPTIYEAEQALRTEMSTCFVTRKES